MTSEDRPSQNQLENMDQKELEQYRTKCEVYSRVVGYLRPVEQYNKGKQQEFQDRDEFKIPK